MTNYYLVAGRLEDRRPCGHGLFAGDIVEAKIFGKWQRGEVYFINGPLVAVHFGCGFRVVPFLRESFRLVQKDAYAEFFSDDEEAKAIYEQLSQDEKVYYHHCFGRSADAISKASGLPVRAVEASIHMHILRDIELVAQYVREASA